MHLTCKVVCVSVKEVEFITYSCIFYVTNKFIRKYFNYRFQLIEYKKIKNKMLLGENIVRWNKYIVGEESIVKVGESIVKEEHQTI